MDRGTILEVAETEIPAAAILHADAIFEPLSVQIGDSITEQINEWLMDNLEDGELEEVARDLIQPAFALHVSDRLAHQFSEASTGWRRVFWTNMIARYETTGEV